MADKRKYAHLKNGYYWILPVNSDGMELGWQPMELIDGRWLKIGEDRHVVWANVKEVGPKIELHDSKASAAWESAMVDVEEMAAKTNHHDEEGKLCFGPFSEWYQDDHGAVNVSWYNLIYHLEQREKMLAARKGS